MVKSVLSSEITKLSVLGVSAEFARLDPVIASDDLVMIGNQLRLFLEVAKNKRVILVIDEIQHLITAKEFEPLQYMLRSILDELNEDIGVLYTGSSRKGLEAMFNNKDMPFYNSANQVAFPTLDRGYVDHVKNILEQHFSLNYCADDLFDFFKEVNFSAFGFDRLARHLPLEQGTLEEGINTIFEISAITL